MTEKRESNFEFMEEPAKKHIHEERAYFDEMPDHLILDIMEFVAAPELGVSLDGLRAFAWLGATCRRMRALSTGAGTESVWRAVDPGNILDDIYAECAISQLHRYGQRGPEHVQRRRESFCAHPRLSLCETLGGRHGTAVPEVRALVASGRMLGLRHVQIDDARITNMHLLPSIVSITQHNYQPGVTTARAVRNPAPANCVRNAYSLDKLVMPIWTAGTQRIVADEPGITSLSARHVELDAVELQDALRRLPALTELECDANAVTVHLLMNRSPPLLRLEKLTLFADHGIRGPIGPLGACFPALVELHAPAVILAPEDLRVMASMETLAVLRLYLPKEATDEHDAAIQTLGSSAGTPFRSISITRGGGISLEAFFHGRRCSKLESVTLLDRTFTWQEAGALIEHARETLTELHLGPYY